MNIRRWRQGLCLCLLTLLLSGCSLQGLFPFLRPDAPIAATTELEPAVTTELSPVRESLYELTCVDRDLESWDLQGDLLVGARGDFYGDREHPLELTVCNVDQDVLLCRRTVTLDPDQWGFDVKFHDAGILLTVYREGEEEQLFFDLSLELLEIQPPASESSTFTSPFFPDWDLNDYESYTGKGFLGLVLREDPEKLYLWEEEDLDWSVSAADSGLFLLSRTDWQEDGESATHLAVLDPRQGVLVNCLDLDGSLGWYNGSALTRERALLYQGGEGEDPGFLIWEFNRDAISRPLPIRTHTMETMVEKRDRLARTMTETYGVDFRFLPWSIDMNGWSDDYPFGLEEEKAPAPLPEYDFLKQTDEILKQFPQGILRESYDLDWAEGLDFYVVNSIVTDNVGAFATNQNGRIAAVFPTGFGAYNVPHELMHCMEYRFWDQLDYNLDDEWYALNPEDFSYLYGEETPEAYEPYRIWSEDPETWRFFSDYAMTNELEDRAVTFERLFNSAQDPEPPDWTGSPGLMAKAQLLCRALREAYPSAAAAETLPWEKWVTTNDSGNDSVVSAFP